jgi:hypothetical protein
MATSCMKARMQAKPISFSMSAARLVKLNGWAASMGHRAALQPALSELASDLLN